MKMKNCLLYIILLNIYWTYQANSISNAVWCSNGAQFAGGEYIFQVFNQIMPCESLNFRCVCKNGGYSRPHCENCKLN